IAVRVRSTRPPVPALLRPHTGSPAASVEFLNEEEGVSPGQACVFYDSAGPAARVLGGGIIRKTRPALPLPTMARAPGLATSPT
ncbi:MAG: tRNA 2-thiouridine(34) synthase MnmA, partial [Methylobacteriaceae bacterium]|nr:tRNA 2-thiouridine(34) synthase MnmA [Methylobacteriaceae bacterium]